MLNLPAHAYRLLQPLQRQYSLILVLSFAGTVEWLGWGHWVVAVNGRSDVTISKEGCGESNTRLKQGGILTYEFFVTIFKTFLNVHVQICFLLRQC